MLRIRRVDSAIWRDRICALRYRAYRRHQAIPENPTERFGDSFDLQANHVLWALTEGINVVGSIRVTWHKPGMPYQIPEQIGYAPAIRASVPPSVSLFRAIASLRNRVATT